MCQNALLNLYTTDIFPQQSYGKFPSDVAYEQTIWGGQKEKFQ